VKQKYFVISLLISCILVITGCSTGNSGNADKNMPQPQVRVQLKPTSTPEPTKQIEAAATAEVTSAPTAAYLLYDPTPDPEALANDIQAMMDQIDSQLKAENFQLK